MTLRVWSDHPAYKTCSALTNQDFIELTADFYQSQYGLDARKWTQRPLTEQEKNELLARPRRFTRQTGVRFRIRQAKCGRDQRSTVGGIG